uniref:Uncharacterized protein n=1 Tax=Hemiselmis andersenii TaxID=464988 RepID=A0A6T8PCN0_HEMAN|mmetsp:Transcript_17296/g.39916  ORF Transcript_17296/g.39916 Transcript_17296/m.39916 type:complete len:152 (+) Transcript_17296:286-741(+)|eukprot:CAMPEP_0114125112 /NCGR_PEP_ID=MMETSP0043_2-20121206/9129_1 /TAXON_ID=464988 /ORGANISM="Hemiselmis andersenii, Strain CCMP644" /LENGTH=151 /DNA_ID=CAMNT_0001218021 /DNA_START=408 /DNA_END=863 /DNA_ORIENTATION=-
MTDGPPSQKFSRKRSHDSFSGGLCDRLATWMQENTLEAHTDVRSTVQLAMELERDVRRCLNQRAQGYERHRLESLRVALANPIPVAAPPPRARDLFKNLEDGPRRSPLAAVRRAKTNPNPTSVKAEIISSSKETKSEVALMEILTLKCESA